MLTHWYSEISIQGLCCKNQGSASDGDDLISPREAFPEYVDQSTPYPQEIAKNNKKRKAPASHYLF